MWNVIQNAPETFKGIVKHCTKVDRIKEKLVERAEKNNSDFCDRKISGKNIEEVHEKIDRYIINTKKYSCNYQSFSDEHTVSNRVRGNAIGKKYLELQSPKSKSYMANRMLDHFVFNERNLFANASQIHGEYLSLLSKDKVLNFDNRIKGFDKWIKEDLLDFVSTVVDNGSIKDKKILAQAFTKKFPFLKESRSKLVKQSDVHSERFYKGFIIKQYLRITQPENINTRTTN